MKKTAVEWLIEELKGVYESDYLNKLVQQAKEMEKEQIKNAWLNSLTKGDFNSAEQYYNETFKQQEQ
jgi:hypothetical protein